MTRNITMLISEEIDDFWENYFTKKYEKMLDDHIYRKFFSVK